MGRSRLDMIAAEIIRQGAMAEQAKKARVEKIIADGPPAGSGITAERWKDWHRYGFVACPGRKGGVTCEAASCCQGARCRLMKAKGLHGDGSPILRRSRPVCGAKTRAGGECRMRVEAGKHRCRLHGGTSTGPKTAEGRERIAEAQRRRWAARAEELSTQ